MLKHEFAVMPVAPRPGERFGSYEPQKYSDVVSVSDEALLSALEECSGIKMYAHCIDIPCDGLVYYGITLISPRAAEGLLKITGERQAFAALNRLLCRAIAARQFVIHFGI